ncbi:MAG TPA: carboxylating nicotinate-nucleotide diphosphorylase [Candidatus Manganitrophaceae bacterium]|nr:carboxylating nicotinate-nucleotide diphosphorylase [Candidatus Manganitrophaceae bacterium]
MIESIFLKELAQRALAEDLAYGDRTTEALFSAPRPAVGTVVAKEPLVVAGLDLFRTVFQLLDPGIRFEAAAGAGEAVQKGATVLRLFGDAAVLLKGERTALNFLQRLSGVATLTRRFVDQVAGTPARIVDTRKTTPGLRALEKEAVRLGGGINHRLNLADLILIKDNHIALAGGIAPAVKQARAALSHALKIEVEVTSPAEVEEAIQLGVEIIMLDNMDLKAIREAVQLIRKKAPSTRIEISGGVRLETVAAIARCGVDLISVGALTHSAPAVDISLEIAPLPKGKRKEAKGKRLK